VKKSNTQGDSKAPAQMAVSEVLDGLSGVPLAIRFWLERFASGESALEPFGAHDQPSTQQIARLVYDVLSTDSHVPFARTDDVTEAKTSTPRFPAEARDFIEEWIFQITRGQLYAEPWSNPDMAVMALSVVLDLGGGEPADTEKEPTLALLRTAIKSLTTKRERRAFLRDTDEADEETEADTENWRAAFKLARVMANPATPQEARDALTDALIRFSMTTDVTVDHPALARRAFLIMCETKPIKGEKRAAKRDRQRVLDILDAIEEKGGARDAE
jgi:hypothetical protein